MSALRETGTSATPVIRGTRAPITRGTRARGIHVSVTVTGLLAALALAGCAGPDTPPNSPPDTGAGKAAAAGPAPPTGVAKPTRKSGRAGAPGSPARAALYTAPRIVHARAPLQCVPYARRHVKISLRGEAWTWWRSARGRYERGSRPRAGSVLVLKRRGRSLGHIAVVTRIVGPREIIADHANWLNRGRIHLGTPVRDVSKNNDWSAVRVWYTPGRSWGRSVYPAYGFIYPGGADS